MRSDYTDLPYGIYHCADGSAVYFNRTYKPIIRIANGVVTTCDPAERIQFRSQEWFYRDADNSPRHDRATLRRLKELVESIPELENEIKRRRRAEKAVRS